ncbi:hypothetical protein PLICRDRAFT_175660 [Plicaturopsis crispa FD-325 SS-3]|nr:hypothetical protein PLICRDRAFT_175660 [Plicaturopsis crispa FD-325 SS-3]
MDKGPIYEASFDYCFPVDFKMKSRDRLTDARQGRDTKVRDSVRDLESLAARFPDVTNKQFVEISWKGMNQYLGLYLIEQGLNPERTELLDLVETGSRKEEVRETQLREEREYGGRTGDTSQSQYFESRATGLSSNDPQDDAPKVLFSPKAESVAEDVMEVNQATSDLTSEVFAGQQIDLDNFLVSMRPDKDERAWNIAGDPYAAAKFFHWLIAAILETLFQVKVTAH